MNHIPRIVLLTALTGVTVGASACVDETADSNPSTTSGTQESGSHARAQDAGKRVDPEARPGGASPAQPTSKPTRDSSPEQPTPPMEGTTPPITARFDGDTLHLRITAPSGGHAFTLVKVEAKGNDSEVRVCYLTPAEGEATTAALVDHDLQTEIATQGGSVRIYVQERQRGAEYFVEPEFKLAQTLAH